MLIYQSQLFGSVNQTQNLRKNVIGEAMWRNVFQHNADWLRAKRTENTRTVNAGILVRYRFWEYYLGLRVIRGTSISSREMPPCWKVPS